MHAAPFAQPAPGSTGGRLKYADPRDLPSFPSLGLRRDASAASAAASLGWATQRTPPKSPKHSPSISVSSISIPASTAALLAHDARMPATSISSEPSNVSLKAATLAAEQSTRRSRQSSNASMSSNAASQAFRNASGASSPRQTPTQTTFVIRQGSVLTTATGALPNKSGRPRSQSSPLARVSYPGQGNRLSDALSAATLAHRPSITSTVGSIQEVGAVPYTTLPRAMFTSTPPVQTDTTTLTDEKRSEKLHLDAVAMAKRMYAHQRTMIDATKRAHAKDSETPIQGISTLQDAAFKLAQERLSKLEDEHQQSRDFQDYYGATSATQSRFSSGTKLRRRASSDSDVIEDQRQSAIIRRQMSIFNNKLTDIDEKKREEDRQSLLAVAHKNVQAQLDAMDCQIGPEAGRPNSSARHEWELKAQAAARLRRDERAGVVRSGKVDIGGGKFVDMSTVEELAARRLQPVFDDIHERASKERERQEQLKAEHEAKKKEAEEKKVKERDVKEAVKKQKDQQKQEERERKNKERQEENEKREHHKLVVQERRDHRKEEEQHRKDEERQKKEEEKTHRIQKRRQAREDRHRKKELAAAAKALKRQQQEQGQGIAQDSDNDSDGSSLLPSRPSTPELRNVGDTDATSPKEKVKTWLKSRFTRPRGRSNVSVPDMDAGILPATAVAPPAFGGASTGRPGTSGGAFVEGTVLSRSANNLSIPVASPTGARDVPFGSPNNMGVRDVPFGSHVEREFLGAGESEIPMNATVLDRPVSLLSSSGSSSNTSTSEVREEEEFSMRARSRGNTVSTVGGGGGGLMASPQQVPLGNMAMDFGNGKGVGLRSGNGKGSRFQEMMD